MLFRSPAVSQLPDIGFAGVDHGLHGENHSRFKSQSHAGIAIMQDLRLFVEFLTNSMPAELPHDAESVPFGMVLYCMTDIAQSAAGPNCPDAAPHAFVGNIDQPTRLDRGLPDAEHAAGITVKAILYDCDVDIDDVAVFQFFFAWNTMADHVIDGGAD